MKTQCLGIFPVLMTKVTLGRRAGFLSHVKITSHHGWEVKAAGAEAVGHISVTVTVGGLGEDACEPASSAPSLLTQSRSSCQGMGVSTVRMGLSTSINLIR